MSSIDFLLSKLEKISSKAWLEGFYDEDLNGKLKFKFTLRYFGVLTLDQSKGIIVFDGSFWKIKKKVLIIPFDSIHSVNVIGNKLKIKWREGDLYHNALFIVGLVTDLKIAVPSHDATKAWKALIEKALVKYKLKLKRKRKRKAK